MLSAAISGGISYPILGAKGVRSSAPSVYRSALKGGRPKYFDLSAKFDSLKYHCNVYSNDNSSAGAWNFHSESFARIVGKGEKEKIFAGRSAKGIKIDGVSQHRKIIGSGQSIGMALEIFDVLSREESSNIKDLSDYAIYSPFTSILRGVASDHSLATPLGLYGGNLPTAINEVLTQENRDELVHFFQFFPWFRKFGVSRPDPNLTDKQMPPGTLALRFTDRYMARDFSDLYSSDVSEGALYGAFILTLMLHEKSPRIFALDNVDSTLNPGLVRRLVKTIGMLAHEYDKQVILTTHNPTALDALDLFDDEHRLYVVDRNPETGETEANRLHPPADMTREEWAEQTGNAKLSDLWLDGFLGGLPPAEDF